MHFHNKDLKNCIESIVRKCNVCQRFKSNLRGYAQLAPREAALHPWRTVAVDLIGPWKLRINKEVHSFRALTMIDPVTNFVEISHIDRKTSANVTRKFENFWLNRYPTPTNIIYDPGTEFTGHAFQTCLHNYGIHCSPISTKNPQANAVC